MNFPISIGTTSLFQILCLYGLRHLRERKDKMLDLDCVITLAIMPYLSFLILFSSMFDSPMAISSYDYNLASQ